jgi:DsbE subfamily thiol:disulfide oxidoreductase
MIRSLALTLLLALGIGNAHAGEFELHEFRGRVLLVDFWASWCTSCRQEFAWLNEMHEEFARRGLTVVGINVDEDHRLAEEFLREHGARFQVVYDPGGAIANAFKVQGMPTTVFVDRDGHLRYQHVGFQAANKEQYESQLRELLDEKGILPL